MDRIEPEPHADIGMDPAYVKLILKTLSALRVATYSKDDPLQFLAFAATLASRSKAQYFQDLWALWEAGGKRGGYFVEFGAASGVKLSNTFLLEKEMGWSGILAEPNPAYLPSIQANRSCFFSGKCVYSTSGERLSFLPVGELSRIVSIVPGDAHEARRSEAAGEPIIVETIALNDLMWEAKAPRQIDYMSVDTEGSELAILRAFDFDQWDIAAISVEHNRTPAREDLLALLTSRGYQRKWPQISQLDDWYVKRPPC